VDGGAIAAIAESGIVSPEQEEAELFRSCAEFCALCVAHSAFAGQILGTDLLQRFCAAARDGTFENRFSSFTVFEAALSAPALLSVIAAPGTVEAIVEVLGAADAAALLPLLRLLAGVLVALPDVREAAPLAEGVITELEERGDPEIAELAAAVLRILAVD
jgi:hypothetical protein